MSTLRSADVICGACQHRFAAEIADSLNVERMPAARKAVLDRTLNGAACPSCMAWISVTQPVLYVDMPRGLWIYCLPAAERGDLAGREAEAIEAFADAFRRDRNAAIVQTWRDRLTMRLVFGYEQLREKVVCADAELDDVIVELLKEQVLLAVPALLARGARVTLEQASATTLTFWTRADGEEELDVVEVARAAYEQLAARRELLAADNPALFERPHVQLERYR
jgi:CpXC protein